MKQLFVLFMLAFTLSAAAATQRDTVGITDNITKTIVDEQLVNGKRVTRYYVIAGGRLIPSNRETVRTIKLCRKYNAKCALAAVVNKKTKRVLRIILD